MDNNIVETEIKKNEKQNFIEDYSGLKNELKTNRTNLYEMLKKMKSYRERIEDILPDVGEVKDFRNKKYDKYLMRENMIAMSEVIKTELAIRQAVETSIKSEADMVKKYIENYKVEDNEKELTNDQIMHLMNVIKTKDEDEELNVYPNVVPING